MLRYGTSAFTYPVGGGGVFAPVTLDAVASNCTFKVEYILEDPDSLYSRSAKDTSIGFINRCGYWNIDRTFGTQNATPGLGWSNNPCYSTAPVDASVAQWDGSTWKDKGNTAYSGSSTVGNVKSTAAITSYPAVLNLGGVCSLQAELSANRDTLIEGYLATFTASPANQYNYKFYVNGLLKQDSTLNKYYTDALLNEDTLKLTVENIDGCYVTIEQIIYVNSISPNYNEVIDSLANFGIIGNKVITDTLHSIKGKVMVDSLSGYLLSGLQNIGDSIAIAKEVMIQNFIDDQLSYGGFSFSDALFQDTITNGGVFYSIDNLTINDTLIFNLDSNDVFVLITDRVLNIDSLAHFKLLNNTKASKILAIAREKIILNSSKTVYGSYFSGDSILVRESFSGKVACYAKGAIFLEKNFTAESSIDIYYPELQDFYVNKGRNHNCCETTNPCNFVCNGDFEATNMSLITNPNNSLFFLPGQLENTSDCWRSNLSGFLVGQFLPGINNNVQTPDIFGTNMLFDCASFPANNNGCCSPGGIPLPGTWWPTIGIPTNFRSGIVGTPTNNFYGTTNDFYAYIGASSNSTELITTQLTSTLNSNTTYYLEYFTNVATCLPIDFISQSNLIAVLHNYDNPNFLFSDENQIQQRFQGVFNNGSSWTRNGFCVENIPHIEEFTHISFYIDPNGENGAGFFIDDISLKPLADAGEDVFVENCGETSVLGPSCPIPGAIYSWAPSSGLSCSDCPNPTITATQNITYTLTVTAPSGLPGNIGEEPCTSTDEVNIIVTNYSVPQISFVTPQGDCIINGEYSVSSSDENAVYNWSSSSSNISFDEETGSSVNVEITEFAYPNMPITVFTQFENGCTSISELLLTPCCETDYTFINKRASNLYSWNGSAFISEYPQIVSLANASGPNPPQVIINGSANTISIGIVGSFTIDVPQLTFTEIDVKLVGGMNSEIIFDNTATFSKTLQIVKNSTLSTCDEFLWKGIIADGNFGDYVFVDESKIEDAEIAITSKNCAEIDIDRSIFNKNHRHLYFRSCGVSQGNLTTSELRRDVFSCVDNSNNPTTIKQFVNQPNEPVTRTLNAIRLLYVNGLLLGSENTNYSANTISDCYIGIQSISSDFRVIRTDFENINQSFDGVSIPNTNYNLTSAAVNASNTIQNYGIAGYYPWAISSVGAITIGSATNINFANNFTNVRNGVWIQQTPLSKGSNSSGIIIANNNFTSGTTAISISGNAALNAVESNVINSFNRGISIRNSKVVFHVNNNLINNSNSLGSVTLNRGISFQNNVSYYPSYIQNNVIGFDALLNSNPTVGIRVDNCNYVYMKDNDVYSKGTNTIGISLSSATNLSAAWGYYLAENFIKRNPAAGEGLPPTNSYGISTNSVRRGIMKSNTIDRYNRGFNLNNDHLDVDLYCNDMDNCSTGIQLTNAALGNEGSATLVPDNRFGMPSGATQRLWGTTSGNLYDNRTWFYRQVLPNDAALETNSSSSSVVFVIPTTNLLTNYVSPTLNNSACGYDLMSGFPSPDNAELLSAKFSSSNARDSLFSGIVDSIRVDTIQNLSGEEYWFVLNQYQIFKHDTSWLNRSELKDSVYQSWFEKVDESSIGELLKSWEGMQYEPVDSVEFVSLVTLLGNDSLALDYLDSLHANKLSSANSDLGRISPQHTFDNYLKSSMGIYGASWAQCSYSLSASDSALLFSYALSNELDVGPACLLSRMMLDLVVFEDSSAARLSGNSQLAAETQNSEFILYPNPGNGTYTIAGNEELNGQQVSINVYSIDGRLVLQCKTKLGDSFHFEASSGLYFLEVLEQTNGLTLFKSKLLHQQK